jgi:hypothetical protein
MSALWRSVAGQFRAVFRIYRRSELASDLIV